MYESRTWSSYLENDLYITEPKYKSRVDVQTDQQNIKKDLDQ